MHGEKSSKYYFNLEKRNFLSKTMYTIKKRDGTLTKDYTEILNEQYNFYSELYTKDDSVHFDISNEMGVRLSPGLKERLESMVSKDELFDAMMTLKPNKSPGGDGFTLEFYRTFWNILKDPLYENYLDSIQLGYFNHTARRGFIHLIPKKSKNDLLLKNWRPISILCVDLKIWSKAIANRLEETVDLIGKQQNGFIKNRSIFNNILTTSEVISHLNRNWKESGVIVTIDFEKCFDRVSHGSIVKTFEYFGFGNQFIRMLKLMFNKLELCTVSNGHTSRFFTKTRGVNQGCPVSPMVYNFCGEIMTHMILKNENIIGIDVKGIRQILSQFADDTATFLKYCPIVMKAFTDTLDNVERQLGLKVSYDKTVIYRVGSLRNSNAQLFTQKNFKWSDEAVDLLGVKLNGDGSICEDNFTSLITKIKNVCNSWINRNATLHGKILIVNTLMGSLFVYKMMALLNLTSKQISVVENIFRNFIWSGKKPKISLELLKKNKIHGGLRLVDLNAKQKALKCSWIFKHQENELLTRCIYDTLGIKASVGNLIWKCNVKPKDVKEICKGDNSFWSQLFEAWCEINCKVPTSKAEIISQVIWYNSFIKVDGKMLSFEWNGLFDSKNIIFLEDIIENGTKKAIDTNWLVAETLWHCIPKEWKDSIQDTSMLTEENEYLYDKLEKSKNRNRLIYDMFIHDEFLILKYIKRWEGKGLSVDYNKYMKSFTNLQIATGITKYRDFQY